MNWQIIIAALPRVLSSFQFPSSEPSYWPPCPCQILAKMGGGRGTDKRSGPGKRKAVAAVVVDLTPETETPVESDGKKPKTTIFCAKCKKSSGGDRNL